jgi:hypothetical protein
MDIEVSSRFGFWSDIHAHGYLRGRDRAWLVDLGMDLVLLYPSKLTPLPSLPFSLGANAARWPLRSDPPISSTGRIKLSRETDYIGRCGESPSSKLAPTSPATLPPSSDDTSSSSLRFSRGSSPPPGTLPTAGFPSQGRHRPPPVHTNLKMKRQSCRETDLLRTYPPPPSQ